jgi:class 3 adenylate cyclase
VHVAARVADLAAPDEVLVTSTVCEALRGVPGEWRLYRVR